MAVKEYSGEVTRDEEFPDEMDILHVTVAGEAGEDQKFSFECDDANAIVDFLKENPDTMMSALGGRVKKPKNFPLKLGEFIKSRSDLFKIDGAYVRLV